VRAGPKQFQYSLDGEPSVAGRGVRGWHEPLGCRGWRHITMLFGSPVNAARLCVGVLPHVAKRPCRRALLTKGGETVSARSSEAVPNAQSWCGLLTRICTRVAAMIHMFVPCAAKRELQRQTARSRVPHRIVICSGGSCCSSTNLRYLLPTSWFTPLIVFL
jgi:hypothetical protein